MTMDKVRACLEASGEIDLDEHRVVLRGGEEDLRGVAASVGVPYSLSGGELTYEDINAADFLGVVYGEGGSGPTYDKHLEFLCCEGVCLVQRACPEAIMPRKARATDAGYDLSIIRKVRDLNRTTALYDTGIRVRVPHGYYTEVVPRSSLSKSGYMLANSVGIIDRSYNGNILVALVRIDDEAPTIEFPFRCCQLLFRRQHHLLLQETTDDLTGTSRGSGGFGSTG